MLIMLSLCPRKLCVSNLLAFSNINNENYPSGTIPRLWYSKGFWKVSYLSQQKDRISLWSVAVPSMGGILHTVVLDWPTVLIGDALWLTEWSWWDWPHNMAHTNRFNTEKATTVPSHWVIMNNGNNSFSYLLWDLDTDSETRGGDMSKGPMIRLEMFPFFCRKSLI